MHVTLPPDIWAAIDADRHKPDKRVFMGLPPPTGIYLASWLRQFIRSHHDLPIDWPDPLWLLQNNEVPRTNQHYVALCTPMQRQSLWFAPHAVRLLNERAAADGAAAATVLRRLLVQHFGRRPASPVRVTGGRHSKTPGENWPCNSCDPMIARSYP